MYNVVREDIFRGKPDAEIVNDMCRIFAQGIDTDTRTIVVSVTGSRRWGPLVYLVRDNLEKYFIEVGQTAHMHLVDNAIQTRGLQVDLLVVCSPMLCPASQYVDMIYRIRDGGTLVLLDFSDVGGF